MTARRSLPQNIHQKTVPGYFIFCIRFCFHAACCPCVLRYPAWGHLLWNCPRVSLVPPRCRRRPSLTRSFARRCVRLELRPPGRPRATTTTDPCTDRTRAWLSTATKPTKTAEPARYALVPGPLYKSACLNKISPGGDGAGGNSQFAGMVAGEWMGECACTTMYEKTP